MTGSRVASRGVLELNPILRRRLVAATRDGRYQWSRTAIAALGVAIVVPIMVLNHLGYSIRPIMVIAGFPWWFAIFILGVVPRRTADALSGEKRDGTLLILGLTHLRPVNFVVGKFQAEFIPCMMGILPLVPAACVVALGEAVSFSVILQLFVGVSLTVASGMAAGLVGSAVCLERKWAEMTGGLVAAVVWALPFVVVLASSGNPALGQVSVLFSPLSPMLMSVRGGVLYGQSRYWLGVAVSIVIVVLLLSVATAILRRTGFVEHGVRGKLRFRERLRSWARRRRGVTDRSLLEVNPFLWITVREPWLRVAPIGTTVLLIGIGAVLWVVLPRGANVVSAMGVLFLLHASLKLEVARLTCSALFDQRHQGMLVHLLHTRLTPVEIAAGLHAAWKRTLFPIVFVVLAVDALLGFAIVTGVLDSGFGNIRSGDGQFGLFVLIGGMAVMLMSDLSEVAWWGMWRGLSGTDPSKARRHEMSAALVFPWVAIGILELVCAFSAFNPLGGSFWAHFLLWLSVGLLGTRAMGSFAKKIVLNSMRRRAELPS